MLRTGAAKAVQEIQRTKPPAPHRSDDSEFGRTRSDLAPFASSFAPGRVSIIIPCYNNEDFVGEAIESALAQTWRDVEVIVVDDGSSDRSSEVISGYSDRVRCVRQRQKGASAARNNGLSVASGEFIQFLDADDVLLPHSVNSRLEVLVDSEADAVFGDLDFGDDHLESIISSSCHAEWPSADPLAYLIRNNIYTEGPLHKRARLFEIGGFDEGLPCSQEFNLHIRLFLHGARFEYLQEVVARAREHSGPSRINNAPWYLEDPDLHLRIVDFHHQLVAGVDGELLTPAVRDAFAFRLWSRGVIAGRTGAFDVARLYFRRAKDFAWPLRPPGSPLFRLTHALLGPFPALWLLYQKQRALTAIDPRRRGRAG